MLNELKRYSDRIRAEGRLPIQARVGVNVGEVLVRSIPTGEGRTEYAPIGHSTGIAARMQALAPLGSIAAMRATGGDLCDQIRYEVNYDTFIAVRCHCRDWRYVSGGEPTVAVAFPSFAVRTVKGLARVFNTCADSGTRVFRAFCAECGAPLFSGSEGVPK